MRTCTWHRVLIELLIISILQYPFARSDSDDVHNSSISDESSTSNGSTQSLRKSDPKITHEIAMSVEPSPKNVTPGVCNYPGDSQDIFKKISHKNGPGWVSLTFNGSKPCNLSNFNDGLRMDSVRLKITGGKRNKTEEWELSVVEHGTWDASKSKLTLNFTNGKNCKNDPCWEPCSDYVLKIVPVIKNQSGIVDSENIHGNLRILTTIENITHDARPSHLEVADAGLDWLLLRWKAPYCLSDQGKMYTVVLYGTNSKWKPCPEILNQNTIITNTAGEYHHLYNMTKCGNITFKPCTEYKLRIRGEYNPAKLPNSKSGEYNPAKLPNSKSGYVNLNSNDINARTIATESLEFNQTTANTLRLSWSFAPPCVNYSSQFSLSVKTDSKNLTDYPVDTDCGNSSCTKDLQLLPCTKYEAKLIPKNASHLKIIKPVQTSYHTSFPDPGENYSITTDLVGFTWVNMQLTLHPRCRRSVQSYRVTLTEEESPNHNMSLNVKGSCVPKNNTTNSVSINVTQSNCVSNFTGFKSCTGRYRVEVFPKLNASLVGLLSPQPIKTSFKLPIGDVTSIPNATISDKGESWIFLNWTAPSCAKDLRKNNTYTLSIYENESATKMAFNITSHTKMNVSTSCHQNPCHNMTIRPCTSYYFEVKANFHIEDLNKKANWTQSNVILTLPDQSQNHVRELRVSSIGSTQAVITWKQPQCSYFVTNYKFQLRDNNNSGNIVASASIPTVCFAKKDQLHLMSDVINCATQNDTMRTLDALEPCTEYEFSVWPLGSIENGSIVAFVRCSASFTTRSAKLGKISSVSLMKSTETSLEVAWGNVTDNARCLEHYEVSVTNTAEGRLQGHNVTTRNSFIFTDLSPCSAYQFSVKTIGKGNDTHEETHEYFTKEPSLGPPQNLNFSLHATFVSLRWDPPESNAKCVKYYRIDIIEWESIDKQPVSTNVTTNDTHVQITKLKPATTYQLHVSARTEAQVQESTRAILNITTPPESETISLPIIPYVFVFIVVGITLLVFLIYWCYYKRNCFGCFEAKQSISPNHRFHPAYYLAGPAEPEAVEETPQGHRNSISVSRHSMRNMGHNRPIPVHDFDAAFNELTENTCILLSEQFADLKVLCNENQPKTCGAKAENKIKNRYINILPYDHSRVHLNSDAEDEHGDYINASYVEGFNGAREYIAAQGPKPITVPDFWQMIWDQEVNIVVMVTQVEEQGKIKCAQYWPDSEQVLTYGDIKVTQVLQVNMDDYVIRDLEVERNGLKRLIKQMHYLTWPDFGCPQNPEAMISFIEAVRDRVSSLSAGGPILVHCSAGVGRTGTFIAIDWLTQEAQVISQIDIFNTVLRLRSDRMNMVQTEDQFHFIHKCISHFLKTRVRKQSSLYENVNAIIPRN